MEKVNVLEKAKAEIEKILSNDSLDTREQLELIEETVYTYQVAQELIDNPLSEWEFGEEGVNAPKYAKAIVNIIGETLYLVYDKYEDGYSLYTKEGLEDTSIKKYPNDYEVKRFVYKK